MGLYFPYVLYIAHAISLQIATGGTLRAMAAGDASQTTPVQIMNVFVLCSFTQIEHVLF